jgi:hypothetical protein
MKTTRVSNERKHEVTSTHTPYGDISWSEGTFSFIVKSSLKSPPRYLDGVIVEWDLMVLMKRIRKGRRTDDWTVTHIQEVESHGRRWVHVEDSTESMAERLCDETRASIQTQAHIRLTAAVKFELAATTPKEE